MFWLVECIQLFKQGTSFDVEDTIPTSKIFFATLKTLLSQHTSFLQDDAQCTAVARVLNQALEAATSVLPKHAYDREMINEQEREQEQEKHQEVLRDPRAERNEEAHQSWPLVRLRESDVFALATGSGGDTRLVSSHEARNTTNAHPFYSLSSFSLDGRPLPLCLPRYVLASHNYFRQSWALNPRGHRRLKNIYVLLEWCPPKKGGAASSATAAGSVPTPPVAAVLERMPSPALTPLQADRWARAFHLLDVDGDGKLEGPAELDSVSSPHMCFCALCALRPLLLVLTVLLFC